MHIQIPSDSAVEFFALRGGKLEPQSTNQTDVPPPTPITDPLTRLTREYNTLRLRLATAERKERQQNQNDCSPRPVPQPPPPSARTPPSASVLLSHLDLVSSSTTTARTTIIETTDSRGTLSSSGTKAAPVRRRTTSAFTYTTQISAVPPQSESAGGANSYPNGQVRRSLSRASTTTRTANSTAEKYPPLSSSSSRSLRPPPHVGSVSNSHIHDTYDGSRRSASRASTRYSEITTRTARSSDVPTIKVTATPIGISTRPRPGESYHSDYERHDRRKKDEMKPAERCKQLEKTLREVQDVCRLRDREIEVLKKERDRILAEREQERNAEKEREQTRDRDRSAEKERERERERERSREREREKEREREREKERERERQRERERDQERENQRIRDREREKEKERERERQREREREREREKERQRERERSPERQSRNQTVRLTRPLSTFTELPEAASVPSTPVPDNNNIRRSKSQAPFSKDINSKFQTNVPILTVESEQLAQLRSLDTFLTKTDGWSGAQVIQAVADLNSEIIHFAASATESCAFERRVLPKPVNHNNSGRGRGRGKRNRNSDSHLAAVRQGPTQDLLDSVPWLGQAFAKILGIRDHAQDPMLVQLALQASVATCCARSLSLFCVGFPSKLDGLLSSVFGHMQSAEPQPTSSRWRSLTHRSIRSLYPGLEEYAISELVTTMLRWSSSVFILSGCASANNTNPKSQPGKEPIVPALHTPTLRAQLRRIAEAVCRLARVTREEILSTSFEVISVECGGLFDAVGMLNAFNDHHDHLINGSGSGNGRANGRGEKGKVLCTTELGLRCTTRRTKLISGPEPDEETKEDMFERRVLLPPKVMLDSAVDALE